MTVINELDRQRWDDNTAKAAGRGFPRPRKGVTSFAILNHDLIPLLFGVLSTIVVFYSQLPLLPLFTSRILEGIVRHSQTPDVHAFVLQIDFYILYFARLSAYLHLMPRSLDAPFATLFIEPPSI